MYEISRQYSEISSKYANVINFTLNNNSSSNSNKKDQNILPKLCVKIENTLISMIYFIKKSLCKIDMFEENVLQINKDLRNRDARNNFTNKIYKQQKQEFIDSNPSVREEIQQQKQQQQQQLQGQGQGSSSDNNSVFQNVWQEVFGWRQQNENNNNNDSNNKNQNVMSKAQMERDDSIWVITDIDFSEFQQIILGLWFFFFYKKKRLICVFVFRL